MPHKILIVDDEADILEVTSNRLKANGFEILTASDGQEGLEKTKTEKPDLILLDLMMPIMDGYTMLEKLKASEDTKRIPVIIASAKNQKQDVERAKSLGAAGYIVKPYASADLISSITKALGSEHLHGKA